MTPPSLSRVGFMFIALSIGLARGDSDDYAATTSNEADGPDWTASNALQLNLSVTPGEWLPQQYTVVPLTENLGLNESKGARGVCPSHATLMTNHC